MKCVASVVFFPPSLPPPHFSLVIFCVNGTYLVVTFVKFAVNSLSRGKGLS